MNKNRPVSGSQTETSHSEYRFGAPETGKWGDQADKTEYSKALPRRGEPSIDLRKCAPGRPRLTPLQEADLIFRAQRGDERAADELILHFIPWLRCSARSQWRGLIRPPAAKGVKDPSPLPRGP